MKLTCRLDEADLMLPPVSDLERIGLDWIALHQSYLPLPTNNVFRESISSLIV